jgi:hypothetical protein
MVTSKLYNVIKDIYTVTDARQLNLEPTKVVTFLGLNELDPRSNQINQTYEKEIPYDPSFCRNDRRVEVRQGVFLNRVGQNGAIISFHFEIIPWTKGIPCIWYNYATNIKIYNLNYSGNTKFIQGSVDINPKDFLITQPPTEIFTSRHFITRNLNTFEGGPNPPGFATYTNRRADVTTQGMNGVWLVIDNN